jgi:hypothetical protein
MSMQLLIKRHEGRQLLVCDCGDISGDCGRDETQNGSKQATKRWETEKWDAGIHVFVLNLFVVKIRESVHQVFP